MRDINTSAYGDIMGLSRPESEKHPRMSRGARAAQFAPFAAMVGHDAAIAEVDRLTERRRVLTDEEAEKLNRELCRLATSAKGTPVEILRFVPDARKTGGTYITIRGALSHVNAPLCRLELAGGELIPFADILSVLTISAESDIINQT